ncbi:MAG: NAD(P)/FAD-dependent oxidoreductase, partial [Candidatus Pacebacteria bacterium]|nr:NAD(P)/FAD-dependent oxidoreductase [Candidatus Paceibacterota bacterium]
QEEVLNNPKIEIIWNTIITEIQGDQFLKGIIIEDVNTKEKKLLNLDGLFLAIGYKATVDFLQGQLELNKDGSIKVIDNTKTSVDGVFAAGDVCDFKYKQAITAAGCGAMALLDVDKWLREQDK